MREGEAVPDDCAPFPIERVHREGSFPYSDVRINGADFRANELHLVHRNAEWLLYLEGGHDESVIDEHFGTVLQLVAEDELRLEPVCAGHVIANDEDSYPLYRCIREVLDSLDFALVKWLEDGSCTMAYSFCPTA